MILYLGYLILIAYGCATSVTLWWYLCDESALYTPSQIYSIQNSTRNFIKPKLLNLLAWIQLNNLSGIRFICYEGTFFEPRAGYLVLLYCQSVSMEVFHELWNSLVLSLRDTSFRYRVIPCQINTNWEKKKHHHLWFCSNFLWWLYSRKNEKHSFSFFLGQAVCELRVVELWPNCVDPRGSNVCISGPMAPRKIILGSF